MVAAAAMYQDARSWTLQKANCSPRMPSTPCTRAAIRTTDTTVRHAASAAPASNHPAAWRRHHTPHAHTPTARWLYSRSVLLLCASAGCCCGRRSHRTGAAAAQAVAAARLHNAGWQAHNAGALCVALDIVPAVGDKCRQQGSSAGSGGQQQHVGSTGTWTAATAAAGSVSG